MPLSYWAWAPTTGLAYERIIIVLPNIVYKCTVAGTLPVTGQPTNLPACIYTRRLGALIQIFRGNVLGSHCHEVHLLPRLLELYVMLLVTWY